MTIIGPDDIFALGTVFLGLAWFGFWADGNRLGKTTSGVLWVIMGGVALSNFGVVPFKAPVYDFIGGYLVPLAIPLLLYKADLRRILRESGPVIITFGIACAGTVIGAIAGFYLIDMGEIGAKAAGTYTGGWTGGAVNFVAVATAVEMTPDEVSVAISANSVVSIMALISLITLPSIVLVRRLIPSRIMGESERAAAIAAEDEPDRLHTSHVAGALALSFVICAIAYAFADWVGLSNYAILFVTVLALVAANAFPRALTRLKGDFALGMIIMYLFFAAVGCGTDALAFVDSALNLFFYSVVILAVHLVVVLTAARFLKIDLAEAIVAAGAALVGPAPAAAIAAARGWKTLVTPGIMCGILGYAIGTFIGVAVAKMLM
ncbi:MAG: DUF819 family protein [Gammaproteobacteria bacterium]|nr:DUF819 family protein [Gammaproteobacteria bacterium]MDE0365633.1 DUF819 family protein [Gammaproteobacteria bacterium]